MQNPISRVEVYFCKILPRFRFLNQNLQILSFRDFDAILYAKIITAFGILENIRYSLILLKFRRHFSKSFWNIWRYFKCSTYICSKNGDTSNVLRGNRSRGGRLFCGDPLGRTALLARALDFFCQPGRGGRVAASSPRGKRAISRVACATCCRFSGILRVKMICQGSVSAETRGSCGCGLHF